MQPSKSISGSKLFKSASKLFKRSKNNLGEDEIEAMALEQLKDILKDEWDNLEQLAIQGGEYLDDEVLLRFLRAEKQDAVKAAVRLRKHVNWRAEFVPKGRVPEDEIQNQLLEKKSFLQGCDKKGKPLFVLKANRHDSSKSVIEEAKRLVVFGIDAAIESADPERNPYGAIRFLFDLEGIGYNNLDSLAAQAVIQILQQHYPERCASILMYKAPTIFWAFWQMLTPFLDPVTKDKVKFIYDKSEFVDEFDPEVVPVDYGGSAQLIPVEEAAREIAKKSAAAVLS